MAMSVCSVRSVVFMSGAALVAALSVFESPVHGANDPGRDHRAFLNGVAAGDVTPTSAILWAHSAVRGPLRWSYHADGERRDAERGIVLVRDSEVPIRVTLQNLEPATRYTYASTSLTGDSSLGTFETPARPYALHGLRFGVTGDVRGDLPAARAIATAKAPGPKPKLHLAALPGQIAEPAIVLIVVGHAAAGAGGTARRLRAAHTNNDNMPLWIDILHQQLARHGHGLSDDLDGVHSSTVANSSIAAPRVREIQFCCKPPESCRGVGPRILLRHSATWPASRAKVSLRR